MNTTRTPYSRARNRTERRADARATASHTDATPLEYDPERRIRARSSANATPPDPLAPHTMALVDSDDDAPPPPRRVVPRVRPRPRAGHDVRVCGHHRRVDDDDDDLPRPRLGHDEPIIEVIDKFLCLGAFEHTSKEDVLLACGIRTVMNVRLRATSAAGGTREGGRGAATGRERGEGRGTLGGLARERDAARRTEGRARTDGDEIEGARRRVWGRRGMGRTRSAGASAVTDERRDARERTERAAVHAVL